MAIDIKEKWTTSKLDMQARYNFKIKKNMHTTISFFFFFPPEWQYESQWNKGKGKILPQCKLTAVFAKTCDRILFFNILNLEKLNLTCRNTMSNAKNNSCQRWQGMRWPLILHTDENMPYSSFAIRLMSACLLKFTLLPKFEKHASFLRNRQA